MPYYKYKCNSCLSKFEKQKTIAKRKEVSCVRCLSDEIEIVICATQFKEKDKWKITGKGKLDSGVPFGNLPGDSDYKNINSPYGPKP